jgi:hypothetical protein
VSRRKLVIVNSGEENLDTIISKLNLSDENKFQLKYMKMTAKYFLENELLKEKMEGLIFRLDDIF